MDTPKSLKDRAQALHQGGRVEPQLDKVSVAQEILLSYCISCYNPARKLQSNYCRKLTSSRRNPKLDLCKHDQVGRSESRPVAGQVFWVTSLLTPRIANITDTAFWIRLDKGHLTFMNAALARVFQMLIPSQLKPGLLI